MPIENGYIMVSRSLLDSEIYSKPLHFRDIWIWLLLKANHEKRIIQGRTIERGQVLTSYSDIIEGLRWAGGRKPFAYTKNEVQSAFRYLKSSNMVVTDQSTQKSTHKMIVTICNYDYYQNSKNYQVHKEIHSKSTASPHYNNNVLKNERSVYSDNTQNYSIEEIKEGFRRIQANTGILVKKGKPEEFYSHYKANGWKRTGARGQIVDIDALITQWVYNPK